MSRPPRNVRLGVVGTGAIAQVAHLPILARMRGVDLVAIHDTDRSTARSIGERFGVARVHRTLEEMLADDEVEGVIVSTPSHLHEEQVRAALEAGKYVLCEKPLALESEGARRILEVPGAESRLMVAMNLRFRPDATALRSFVSTGELGDVFYLRAGWLVRRRGNRGRRTWRQRKAGAGGGALMDLGVQMLDLSLWLLGYPEPERVMTLVHRPTGGEVEDSAVVLIQFAGNLVLNLEVTWVLLSERERQYVHALGNQGSGSLSPLKVYKDLDGELVDVTPPVPQGRENAFTASYRQQLTHFADVVRGRGDLEAPTEQVTLLRILEAAYRSAEQGEEVRLL